MQGPLQWIGVLVVGIIALMLVLPLIGFAFGVLMLCLKVALIAAVVVFVAGVVRRLTRA